MYFNNVLIYTSLLPLNVTVSIFVFLQSIQHRNFQFVNKSQLTLFHLPFTFIIIMA